jgi:hypothetical protein
VLIRGLRPFLSYLTYGDPILSVCINDTETKEGHGLTRVIFHAVERPDIPFNIIPLFNIAVSPPLYIEARIRIVARLVLREWYLNSAG